MPFQVHQPPHILVLGGSLGALALNQIVPEALAKLARPVVVRHQCGRDKAVAVQERYSALKIDGEISEFIDDMAAAYAWADMVICRAGALTLSELAQSGRPAILVPYPYAVDDHQTANAAFLVQATAAHLLPQTITPLAQPWTQQALSIDSLTAILGSCLDDPQTLAQMAAAAKQCAMPSATQAVVNHCVACCAVKVE